MATFGRQTNEGCPERASLILLTVVTARTAARLLLVLELAFLAAAVMRVLELHFLPLLAVLDLYLVGHERLRFGGLSPGDADGLADRIRQRLGVRRQRPGLAVDQHGDGDSAGGTLLAAGHVPFAGG